MLSFFLIPNFEGGKNVIIFDVDNTSSTDTDNRKKYIIVLGEGPTQGLVHTTITAEVKYSVNITTSRKKFCLSLHYNGSNSFLYANVVKIYQIKAKDSKTNSYPVYLGNI